MGAAAPVRVVRGLRPGPEREVTLLNVSYDPTRELYEEINPAFAKSWEQRTGQKVHISQSHGGSGRQARAVIDGLPADVVTLALAGDVDAIAEQGRMLPLNWAQRLPHNSAPYVSTIVFLVRAGNPKKIHDWGDLVRARCAGDHAQPQDFGWRTLELPRRLGLGRAPARRDTRRRTRVRAQALSQCAGARHRRTRRPDHLRPARDRRRGDFVENEAHLALREMQAQHFEIVVPTVSILAEPSVAVVDKVVLRRGTREAAEAYLGFLYTPEGQEIAARNFYRPRDESVAAKYADNFPKIELVVIDHFGGWKQAQKEHFATGGVFDQITTAPK